MTFPIIYRYILRIFGPLFVLNIIKLPSVIALTSPTSPTSSTPPNIILVLTDDQDIVLEGMTPMEKTMKLLADNGATFTNAFAASPVCCPSRSSIVTGQYVHNHRTFNNSKSGGCYSHEWVRKFETRTFPVYLNNNGYRTFYGGKYLNEYFTTDVPPGYTDWYGLYGNSKYYNYRINDNGTVKHFGTKEEDYLTDVLSARLEKFLSEQKSDKPFLAVVATPAAHAPFTPAERHKSTFKNVTALRTPNFNIKSTERDKHWLARKPPVNEDIITNIDDVYRRRWETLLAVDELVESMVESLKQKGLYENTYIVFTSDHGYHCGQFAMPWDKRQPYETDIRVPFIVTGPGIRTKSVIKHPILLLDLMPTFLDWAGIEKPIDLDGKSFSSLFNTHNENTDSSTTGSEQFDRKFLIEYWGEGSYAKNNDCPEIQHHRVMSCGKDNGCHCQDSWNNTYGCVRRVSNDVNNIYCEFEDNEAFVEAYDLNTDPFQMKNLGFDLQPEEQSAFIQQLIELKNCEGQSCRK